jgi:hypothetical protein
VFAAFFAMRALPSRRGRRRPPSGSTTNPFTGASSATHPSDSGGGPLGGVTFTGIAPGWLIDPSGRHELRYWSGSEWTEHVTDGGTPGTDPPPAGAGRRVDPS